MSMMRKHKSIFLLASIVSVLALLSGCPMLLCELSLRSNMEGYPVIVNSKTYSFPVRIAFPTGSVAHVEIPSKADLSPIQGDDVRVTNLSWNDGKSDFSRDIAVMGATEYSVQFENIEYKVIINSNPLELVENFTCWESGYFTYKAPEKIEKIESYVFSYWTKNGELYTTSNQLNLSVEEPLELTAVYSQPSVNQPSALLVSDKNVVAGRVAYLEVTAVDISNEPIPGVGIKITENDSDFYSIHGDLWHYTDSSGKVIIPVLFTSAGVHSLRAVTENGVYADFTVNVSTPSWIVFVWLASDNNLYSYALSDIEEMLSSDTNVAVVYLLDEPDSDILDGLYALTENRASERIELFDPSSGEVNSGSWELLQSCAQTISEWESTHKAIVIWNHGSAWDDTSPYYKVRGIGYDDSQGDFLTAGEIVQALEGTMWDVLGMDACLMGSVEVIYELRNTADFIVASAYSEPGEGWNYEFLAYVDGLDPLSFSKRIVDEYFDVLSQNLSLAVYDTHQMDRSMDELNAFLNESSDLTLPNTLGLTCYSYSPELYDLGEVLSAYENAASSAYSAFSQVVAYSRLTNAKSTSLALSIFLPDSSADIDSFGYSNTRFAQDSLWDEYLKAQLP